MTANDPARALAEAVRNIHEFNVHADGPRWISVPRMWLGDVLDRLATYDAAQAAPRLEPKPRPYRVPKRITRLDQCPTCWTYAELCPKHKNNGGPPERPAAEREAGEDL